MKFIPLFILLSGIGVVAGCAHEKLPVYPDTEPAAALRLLADRSRSVHAVSSEGSITLTRPDGQSVRLDAALAMRPPDNVRIRAWKFGQAVFDLTLTPGGLWLITPDDSSRKERMKSAGISAGQFARAWSLFNGGFFETQGLWVENAGAQLRITRGAAGEMKIVCIVDRATLTPRRYTMTDPSGENRFELALDRYTQVGTTVWPQRMTAHSQEGDIVIELHDVEINGEIPPGAFTPPRRAEKLP
jgi:outer membrane lipoprotein-sorting protein